MGARYFAQHPIGEIPTAIIILDMVGGRDMSLDIDGHILRHPASRRLTYAVFHKARRFDMSPFTRSKKNRVKNIICDHIPFLMRGIPSCLLIDMDYPEWHTHRDLPDALSEESMVSVETVMLDYLADFALH